MASPEKMRKKNVLPAARAQNPKKTALAVLCVSNTLFSRIIR